MVHPMVSLRQVREDDFRQLIVWEADPLVRVQFGAAFSSLGAYSRYRRQLQRGERYALAIELDRQRMVGYIELVHLAWRARAAELCVLIGEEADRGQGYGSAAIQMFVSLAFGGLKLDRLFLRVASGNLRARRCYERCGFRARARLPVSRRQPERKEALILMELWRREWLGRRARAV